MTKISGEIVIGAPVTEVFDFVADQRNEVAYNPHMIRSEKVTAGPVGQGTRFRSAVTTLGRSAGMDIEYTGFQRPRQLASTTRMAQAEFSGTLTFEPAGAGTRLRWSWDASFAGPLRVLTPLLARVGGRQERATWAALKQYLESRHPESPAAGGTVAGGTVAGGTAASRTAAHGPAAPPGQGVAGAALLAASVAGVPAVVWALRRLGRPGSLLVAAACSALFARDAGLALTGAPARLLPLPRALLFTEVALSGTAAGTAMAAGARRRGPAWPSVTRLATVTAAATFVLHTTRFAIYLSPGHGLRGQSQ